jgi:hypothetical protein
MKGLLAKIELTPIDNPKAEGYRNIWEVQKQDGPELSVNRVRELLRLGVIQGILENKKFRIKLGGKVRSVWHWREKKK